MYIITLTDGISYTLSEQDYDILSKANQIGYFASILSIEWIEE